mmetsp:Transcript_14583/g.31622  ORF Transcript_14583/g.31622 Transcript_14583/m.31622 type:complete len:162 (+) Transcript_14583:1427-1912(+)
MRLYVLQFDRKVATPSPMMRLAYDATVGTTTLDDGERSSATVLLSMSGLRIIGLLDVDLDVDVVDVVPWIVPTREWSSLPFCSSTGSSILLDEEHRCRAVGENAAAGEVQRAPAVAAAAMVRAEVHEAGLPGLRLRLRLWQPFIVAGSLIRKSLSPLPSPV